MASPPRAVTFVEESRVSPPPGSVPETSLRLTFFDLLWYKCCPMQRLYFYRFPHPLQHFSDTVVHSLKRSLSFALRRFFPFAGKFVSPPPPDWPILIYSLGDSVPFVVAESSDGDFDALFADRPRGVRELHPFAPSLPPAIITDGGARSAPVMALQVTFFPGSGFILGVTFCHVAADGKSFHHFMKYWASLSDLAGDSAVIENIAPFYGRELMRSLDELQSTDSLQELWAWASKPENLDLGRDESLQKQLEGKVRATFVMGDVQIDKLKNFVRDRKDLESAVLSAFVVTCALVWACVVKSEATTSGEDDEPCFFVFVADCRERLGFPVPSEYFGNCLAFVMVSAAKRDLVGPDGIATAVKVIGERVRAFDRDGGVMEGAEAWLRDFSEISPKYSVVTVAGSPRLGVYGTDFGWGRPEKTEVVHTDISSAISLCDRSDGRPGIELSLVLSEPKTNHFTAVFEETFNSI